MKRLLFVLVLPVLLFATPALAAERNLSLTVGKVSGGSVDGDIDESETIPDYYKDYDLAAGDGVEFRLLLGNPADGGFYISAGSMQADDSANRAHHEFDNLSAGIAAGGTTPFAGEMEFYGQFAFGIGVSRFSSGLEQDRKINALAEGQLELGVVFYKRLAVAMGGKLQVIGYPTETIAISLIPQTNVSFWF